MPTIVDILTFITMINFKLGRVEHENSFISSRPGVHSTLDYTQLLDINKQYCKASFSYFFIITFYYYLKLSSFLFFGLFY